MCHVCRVDEDLMKTLRPRRDILKQLVEKKIRVRGVCVYACVCARAFACVCVYTFKQSAVESEDQDDAATGSLLRQASLEDAPPTVELTRPSAREELLRMVRMLHTTNLPH